MQADIRFATGHDTNRIGASDLGAADPARLSIHHAESPADRETGIDADPQDPLARSLIPPMEMDRQQPSIRQAFLVEGQDAPPGAGSWRSSATPASVSSSFPASTSISSVRRPRVPAAQLLLFQVS